MRAVAALLLLMAGCTEEPPRPEPTGSSSPAPPAPRRTHELHIGVGAMLSPMTTFESYDQLLRGLAQHLGRPYQMVQRRTYKELNQLIVDGEVELAFICSGAWVSLPADTAEILVVPEFDGKAVYHGLIVTRADAPYQSFAELEQTRFAFTDPMSNTGYFYPLSRIAALGKKPTSFFSSTIFSGSHDRSILAIERGIVDAAAVFDVGHILPARDLRVLERSPPMAPPPVVAPLSVPAKQRDAMRSFLLTAADRPEGRVLLEALGVDGFRLPTTVDYAPIRRMMETATGAPK